MRTLFYDSTESEYGFVVREMPNNGRILMKEDQGSYYLHSVTEDELKCPKCGGFDDLHFRGDYPDDVSPGYVAACMKCDEDFYLIELAKG